MNLIKHYLEQYLGYIDDGRFFREPLKILYIIFGILPVSVPLFYLYTLVDDWDSMVGYSEGWTKFTIVVAVLLIFVWLLAMAYCAFVYWMQRKNDLHHTIRVGEKIVAIPTLAHVVKCMGESYALVISLSVVGVYVILYVVSFLNGFSFFYYDPTVGEFLKCAVLGIVLFAVLLLGLFVFSYFVVLGAHTISEKLLVKAMIANDVRDLGDIHRAAVMQRNAAHGENTEKTENTEA